MSGVSAGTLWERSLEHRCDPVHAPWLCPGLLVFAKLMRTTIDEAVSLLMSCECEQARLLALKPHDYAAGVVAGVLCRRKRRGGDCSGQADIDYEKIPVPETRANVARLLEAAREAGARTEAVYDEELVHVTVHVGCGAFTVTCGPLGCEVTDKSGVDAELVKTPDGRYRLRYRCARAPPYLGSEYLEYLG